VSRLSDLERRSGRVVRRIKTSRPGELVHIDVKKQAKIPPGGGWRVHGRGSQEDLDRRRRNRVGYAYVHSAVDAHTRLAYSEVHENEQATTAIAFWRRARAFFTSYGIGIERVMTDNGRCYVSCAFGAELIGAAIAHTKTRPYSPRTNGKVERYNRTLLNEWAYARPYPSEAARTRALAQWLHMYNHHRHHTAIGGPPASRVNNLVGQNI
jgi:transposase InsO family protein